MEAGGVARYESSRMSTLPSIQRMQKARRDRDADFDGVFYVCVTSTRIFCKPSCPARSPLEKNVRYLATATEAVRLGFRPCKRCRPLDTNGQYPEWVTSALALSDQFGSQRLRDRDLRAAGLEPIRLRRFFRRRFGVTFHAYHRARRMGSAIELLKKGENQLNVGLKEGYESASGFADAFTCQFKTTPARHERVSHLVVRSIESPIGRLELGATDRGVCLLEFGDRRSLPTALSALERRFGRPVVPGNNAHLDQLQEQLSQYFSGKLREFCVTLDIGGTAFQKQVWRGLQQIEYGKTMSYGELAEAIHRPGAQRAVGRANGCNHVAIVIPCHRVVQSNGALRGYGGGLWRKKFLIDLERDHLAGSADQRPS